MTRDVRWSREHWTGGCLCLPIAPSAPSSLSVSGHNSTQRWPWGSWNSAGFLGDGHTPCQTLLGRADHTLAYGPCRLEARNMVTEGQPESLCPEVTHVTSAHVPVTRASLWPRPSSAVQEIRPPHTEVGRSSGQTVQPLPLRSTWSGFRACVPTRSLPHMSLPGHLLSQLGGQESVSHRRRARTARMSSVTSGLFPSQLPRSESAALWRSPSGGPLDSPWCPGFTMGQVTGQTALFPAGGGCGGAWRGAS